jgi:hypothetical protein
MNCCTDCFKDQEVRGYIDNNSTDTGTCEFCSANHVKLVDARELEEMFLPVVQIYQPVTELGLSEDDGEKLYHKIQQDWEIFNLKSVRARNALLKAILADVIPENSPLFTEPVVIRVLQVSDTDPDFHEQKWGNFANEIKYKNRFFLNENVDLELLQRLMGNHRKVYNKGKIFYRSRISTKDGFTVGEMGKPPKEKTTSGRANPPGIPYLYVSATIETTVYESRSSHLDFITVGTFKLRDELKVVSLREANIISPFILEADIENYVVHQKYLASLGKELSKPIRRFDRELDYLPTQYLCEFVKSLGYDAIEYSSALNKGGINLAIFNDVNLTCKSVDVYEVDDVTLHTTKISSTI